MLFVSPVVPVTIFSSVTVTVQSALLPLPSWAAAVIVTSPTSTAVTSPSSVTVAIVSSEEVHAKVEFVAFSGVTVAVNCRVSPFSISATALSNTISVINKVLSNIFPATLELSSVTSVPLSSKKEKGSVILLSDMTEGA